MPATLGRPCSDKEVCALGRILDFSPKGQGAQPITATVIEQRLGQQLATRVRSGGVSRQIGRRRSKPS
ncbi:hypothetical protein DF153_32935 [Burkholderia cenocepacia]|nr:hypothetical protein DF152_33985 [Burkholderia cenocepacia]RQU12605.1 hypothetical protein DF153_32935 [Burkholderia cenocepacia]